MKKQMTSTLNKHNFFIDSYLTNEAIAFFKKQQSHFFKIRKVQKSVTHIGQVSLQASLVDLHSSECEPVKKKAFRLRKTSELAYDCKPFLKQESYQSVIKARPSSQAAFHRSLTSTSTNIQTPSLISFAKRPKSALSRPVPAKFTAESRVQLEQARELAERQEWLIAKLREQRRLK